MAPPNREGNPMHTHPLSRRAMTRAVVALILNLIILLYLVWVLKRKKVEMPETE